MKQYITKALLCLSVAMLVFNCQKEDDSLELQNTVAPSSKPLNLSRLNTKAIKNDKNLMRIITKAETKRIEAKANKTVYNAQYDFTINTNYAKVITKSNGLKNYTFGVYRTEDNGLLENLLLETQNDGTFKVSLVQYNLTTDARSALANQEIVDVEDKITFTTLEDISDTIFDKVNSDAETCTVYSYEWYQGNSCASGNHEYTDGSACNYWGNPDQMATSGGYVLTANEESCGDGGGSTGNTDGSPNGNPGGNQGGYGSNGTSTIEDPATTPVLCTDCPEISEDDECFPNEQAQLELESVLGAANVTVDCNINPDDVPSELHFDTLEELQAFKDGLDDMKENASVNITVTNTTNDDPSSQNTATTTFEFLAWPYVIYQIHVNQELGVDYQYFTDYSVTDVTSSISGVTFLKNWVQVNWQNSTDSYVSTTIVHGYTQTSLFYQGIGELYRVPHTFTLVTNATDGSFISQSWD